MEKKLDWVFVEKNQIESNLSLNGFCVCINRISYVCNNRAYIYLEPDWTTVRDKSLPQEI